MKSVLKRLAGGLAIASSVLVLHTAHAADINRAFTITLAPDNAEFGDKFNAAAYGKTFRDLFSFTVLSESDLDAGLMSIATLNKSDLDITGFSLFSGDTLLASGSQHGVGNVDIWTLSSHNLGSGTYSLAVEGKVLGSLGGGFGGNLNVAPVPEPSTWGMMLGGFGILGLIARRRKSATPALAV